MGSLRVVIAPDSFKGTMTSPEAGQAMAEGWLSARPHDEVRVFPMADGGEGTLDIVYRATPGSALISVGDVTGPDGRPEPAHFLALDDDTALVELAVSSGITQMAALDAVGATTRGLGETMAFAIRRGFSHLIVALGGSASTDAGLGALEALGLSVTTRTGAPLPPGGGHLADILSFDTSALLRPRGGVTILRDTTATFFDAPAMFGPQKGASADDIDLLTQGFHHLTTVTGDTARHAEPGAGAAGGTGWGLAFFLDATITDGAAMVAQMVGVTAAIAEADLVVTGEGKFDSTSMTGKVTGQLIAQAQSRDIPVAVVAGVVDDTIASTFRTASLVEAAGGPEEALANPIHWAKEATKVLAAKVSA